MNSHHSIRLRLNALADQMLITGRIASELVLTGSGTSSAKSSETHSRQISSEQAAAPPASAPEIVDDIVGRAATAGVSDILIEPTRNTTEIRFSSSGKKSASAVKLQPKRISPHLCTRRNATLVSAERVIADAPNFESDQSAPIKDLRELMDSCHKLDKLIETPLNKSQKADTTNEEKQVKFRNLAVAVDSLISRLVRIEALFSAASIGNKLHYALELAVSNATAARTRPSGIRSHLGADIQYAAHVTARYTLTDFHGVVLKARTVTCAPD